MAKHYGHSFRFFNVFYISLSHIISLCHKGRLSSTFITTTLNPCPAFGRGPESSFFLFNGSGETVVLGVFPQLAVTLSSGFQSPYGLWLYLCGCKISHNFRNDQENICTHLGHIPNECISLMKSLTTGTVPVVRLFYFFTSL